MTRRPTVLLRWCMDPWRIGCAVLLILFLAPRLFHLGTVLTVDEPLWRARAHQFIEGVATLKPAKTFVSGQPGVTAMWLAGLATPMRSLAASQAAIALSTSLLFLLALGLFARLTSPLVAFAGGVVLALDPFLIAHSRVVHTDALLGAFMLLTLLSLALAWRTGQRRYWTYAAVGTALAGLTKIFGLFLLALLLVSAVAAPVRGANPPSPALGSRGRFALRRLARLALPFLLTVLIAWPALLFTPRTPLVFITQRVTLHSQSAPVGSGGGDPWYYPREFLRRLTPTTTVLLPVALVGLLLGTGRRSAGTLAKEDRRLPRFPGRSVLLGLLGTSAVFALLLSFSEQKSDRYVLIAHASLDLAVGAAVVWCADLAARTSVRRQAVAAILLTGVAALLLRDVIRIHPHAMAQWNRLLPVPPDVKLGWGEGLEEAAAYFRSLNIPGRELMIASYYSGVLSFFLPPDTRVERFTRYTDPQFRYAVLYRSMFGREEASYETAAVRAFLGSDPNEGRTVMVDGTPFRLERRVIVNDIPFVWVFRRL